MSQLYYRRTDSSSYRDRIPLRIVRAESELSPLEKAYLGAVEKGDYGSVKQALEVCAVFLQSLLDTLSGKQIRSEIHFHQGSHQHDNCEETFPYSTMLLNSHVTYMLLQFSY